MTDSDIKRLNRVFRQDLGSTPNGQPLYQWMRTRDLFYLIEDQVDTLTPAGLYVKLDRYRKVTWEQRLGPQWKWIIASWHAPGTPQEWKAKYQTLLPYPPQGMYYPLDGSQIPCDPTLEITLEAIAKIRRASEESEASQVSRANDEAALDAQKAIAEKQDEIKSDWPAFDCEVTVPGGTTIQ